MTRTMTRTLRLRNAAICACVGTSLFLLAQTVSADSNLTVSERLAAMNDYVWHHVSCGSDGCQSGLIDEEVAEDWQDWQQDSQACRVCPNRWYVRADYLLWWVSGNRLPPLVTTSPLGMPLEQAGVLGEPGTSVLFGDQRVDNDLRHGVRLTLGRWLDDCQDWGVEGHYFYVGDAGGGYFADSAGNPILARPFFNAETPPGAADSLLVAFPERIEGQIQIDTSSDVHSAGVLLRRNWLRDCRGQVAVLGGYRYFRFREQLVIDTRSMFVDETGLIEYGTHLQVQDSFAVRNDFHGADIGLSAELQRGRWSLDVLTKLGLGGVRQRLDIAGQTQVAAPEGPLVPQNGGLLARASNSGHYSDTQFAFLPELGANVGYCVTPSLSLRAGYSLMWLTDALRTGDQIDLAVGASGGHPQAFMETTSVCVQGISLGGEWRR